MGSVIFHTQSLIFRINFTVKWNVWQDTEVIFKRAIGRSDLNLTYQLKDGTSYHAESSKITLQWQHQKKKRPSWGRTTTNLLTSCYKTDCTVTINKLSKAVTWQMNKNTPRMASYAEKFIPLGRTTSSPTILPCRSFPAYMVLWFFISRERKRLLVFVPQSKYPIFLRPISAILSLQHTTES